jgi:hypothetical protein
MCAILYTAKLYTHKQYDLLKIIEAMEEAVRLEDL